MAKRLNPKTPVSHGFTRISTDKTSHHLCQSVFIRGSIAFSRLNNLLCGLWRTVRRLSGDDGYERYLAHHAAAHPNTPAQPRREWFAQQQRQKWSGIKRCC